MITQEFSEIAQSAYGIRATSPNTRFTEELCSKWIGFSQNEAAERWEVLHCLKRIGPDIGLTPDLLQHLEYLLSHCPEEQWTYGNSPIVFKSVLKQARQLGVSTRTIQNRERRLADLGLILHTDSANYKRFPHRDADGKIIRAFGVNLAPILLRKDEFFEYDYLRKSREAHWDDLRFAINAKRRYVTGLINEAAMNEDLVHHAVDWAEEFKNIRRIRSDDSNAVLEKRLKEIVALEAQIKAVYKDYEQYKFCGWSEDISGMAETDFRHTDTYKDPDILHRIRNSNNENIVDNSKQSSANASQEAGLNMAFGHARPVSVSKREPEADIGDCKQNFNSPAPTGAENLAPEHIYLAGCKKFRDAIERVTGHTRTKDFTFKDIWEAADLLRPYAGVSEQAWNMANQRLGKWSAAISLMISAQPGIRNSGGYLRGMIKAHAKGKLHLHRTVFGKLKNSSGNLN